MNRARLKGVGALLLVFTLGLLIGGAGSRALLQRRYAHFFRDRFSVFEQRRLAALAHRLDLSDTQTAQVRAILGQYGQERRQLTRQMLDRCGDPLRAQKARMDAEIRAQLNPDQQAGYDLLVKDSNRHGPASGSIEPVP